MPVFQICIKTTDPTADLPEHARLALEERPEIPAPRMVEVEAVDSWAAIAQVQLGEGERVAWIQRG